MFVQGKNEDRYFQQLTGEKKNFMLHKTVQDAAHSSLMVKDIRNELRLLRRVFEDQIKVTLDFAEAFWPSKSSRISSQEKDSRKRLRDSFIHDSGLELLTKRVKQMEQDASTTLEGVSCASVQWRSMTAR